MESASLDADSEFRPEAFIRDSIGKGRCQQAEDAVREALALWEHRERTRAELLAAVDAAEASLARDEGLDLTESSIRKIAEDVKALGRLRLTSGNPGRR